MGAAPVHLVREFVLVLACGALGLWVPSWLGGPGPRLAFFTTGMLVALPFQALYAVALLAVKRAPAWLVGLLGAVAWAASLPPALRGGGWLAWLPAAAPPLLALLAGIRLAPAAGAGRRAAAGALYGWAVPHAAGGAALLALVAGAPDLTRRFLLAVGALYLTLRVAAGILRPLQGDPWFLPPDR